MEMPLDRRAMTQLLRQWGKGDKAALDELMPIVYDQLHKLADLKSQGVLTDAEFETQKAKILTS